VTCVNGAKTHGKVLLKILHIYFSGFKLLTWD
jgi:hypothetical protein